MSGHRLVSVMYHYVRDVAATPFPRINAVAISDFRRQVDRVRDTFTTPPLEACVDFLEGAWDPGRDICILTFDDGLLEHHETVADILISNGVPGAFFLPTAAIEDHEVLAVHMNHFLLAILGTTELSLRVHAAASDLGTPIPEEAPPERVRATYRWDDEETARFKYLINHQLSFETSERLLAHVFPGVLGPTEEFSQELYIDWGQARSMQEAGLTIGGHTHRHKVLSNLEPDQQKWDLEHSIGLLRANLGDGPRGFAYPYGKPATYTEGTIGHLAELGYHSAFNTTVDHGQIGTSRWEIPRIDPKDL